VNLDEIKRDILGQDDTPVVKAPFELTLESTTKYLIEWIIEGSNYSTFSIAGLLRSDEFRKILTSTLGSNMSEKFRLMIYLTNDVTTRGEKNAYLGYNATILHTLSHYAGHMVLNAVESRLRPVALAASRTKLNDLQAIFLVLFGISITARYSYLDVSLSILSSSICTHFTQTLLRGQPTNPGTKRRAEGFIRLVNHYIVYISGLINHMDVASRNSLLTTCEFQWDKPGSSVSSLTSDCLDKGSGTYFDKPGGKYVDMLESAAIQESVNCGTSGHLRGILDYHCRCQKCQLDFDALGLGTIIEGQIERSVPPYSSNGEYQAVSHQTELSSSLQHEELSIIGRYYSWGEVPGKFSALITSPSARRKLLQKSESGTGTPRKPLEYGVKLANWVESTKNNFVQEPCSEEKGEEEPPAYWTFFNQNQQFEIYRNVNKCTFTNNPEQIDLANESKRGPPEEYPKPGFGQTHSASALEWERISKSQPIICSGYNTFMGPVPWENVIMCPFGSSLPLAPALTQPECLWCDKTASTYNSNNLCDECNNLLNP
jgi:hypothetical protein